MWWTDRVNRSLAREIVKLENALKRKGVLVDDLRVVIVEADVDRRELEARLGASELKLAAYEANETTRFEWVYEILIRAPWLDDEAVSALESAKEQSG